MYIMSKITTTVRTPVVSVKHTKTAKTPAAQPINAKEIFVVLEKEQWHYKEPTNTKNLEIFIVIKFSAIVLRENMWKYFNVLNEKHFRLISFSSHVWVPTIKQHKHFCDENFWGGRVQDLQYYTKHMLYMYEMAPIEEQTHQFFSW